MSLALHIVPASPAQATAIADLVNQAYRPDAHTAGWTHETGLVAGARINAEQVAALMAGTGTILLAWQGEHVVGCVHVQPQDGQCTVGLLATQPAQQNRGLGKQLLAAAEQLAQTRYAATQCHMSVLAARPELLAYYERRGYRRTGGQYPYPVSAGVGAPCRPDLQVLELAKDL